MFATKRPRTSSQSSVEIEGQDHTLYTQVVRNKRQKHDSGSGENARMSDSPQGRKRETSISFSFDDWSLAIVKLPESGSESVYSVQSKETMVVQSSSDDYWFLDEDDENNSDADFSFQINPQGISVEFNTDPHFSEEFEPNDEEPVCPIKYDFNSSGSESPQEEIFVVYNGSDEDFWADSESVDSSEFEFELADGDKWECQECGLVNRPLRRFCDRCMTLRPEWLSQKRINHSITAENLMASKPQEICKPIIDSKRTMDESFDTLPVSDIEVSEFELQQCDSGLGASFSGSLKSIQSSVNIKTSTQNSTSDNCIICMLKPKTGSIIHGKTGHQACCYKCAKQLKRKGKSCPVCRRPIQQVIRNYVV